MLTAALGQNPMLWRTSPAGTELEQVVVDWLRQALGLPDGVRRAPHRHRVDVVADRPRCRPPGRRHRCRGRGDRRAIGRARAPGLRLGGGPFLDREGVHDARARPGVARPDPDERAVRAAARCARGGDRRRSSGRPSPDRDRRDGRDDLVDLGRSGGGGRRHRRSRGPLAPRRRRLCRRRRDRSRASRAVRRLGAGRLDRRQPAQVAVDAGRRLAPAQPPARRRPRRVQPRARVPADGRRRRRGARLQRVHAAARAADAGPEALDPAPLVRPRGAPAPDPPPPRARPGVRRLGRRRARLGAARAGPVLDRLLPPRPGRARPATRPPLDAHNAAIMDAVNRTGEIFLSPHEAPRPVHDPARDRQPPDGGAPRRAGVGAASQLPPRRSSHDERAGPGPLLLPDALGRPRRVRRAVPAQPLADPARAARRRAGSRRSR